jgi:ATP-dependent exoDNAse (exonuclease V) beta subunit
LPEEIWVVDFKTDQVNANELAEKTHNYQRQLRLYARALRRIYGRPVTRSWLHFLTPGQSVTLQPEIAGSG